MNKLVSCLLFVAFILFVRLDVTKAGGSPNDVCLHYVENFENIYNETISKLTQSFQNDNQTLYSINVYIPRADYAMMIEDITHNWYDNNLYIIQNAFNQASSLTGVSVDYINQLIDSGASATDQPLSCIYDLILDLTLSFYSYTNSIISIGQVLVDAQINVGQARPST